MKTILRNTFKLTVMLLLVAGLFGGAGSAYASSLPTSPCVSSAGATACDVYATKGTATLFGTTTVNIWGYSATATPGSASLPGPILIVNQGDSVTVTLHNVEVPEATAINFQGQSLIPDTTGVTTGNSKAYTFTASKPGTFLYEAGLIPNSEHQVAMGMYGVLVVKPADGTAYGSTATAYNEETALVLSEIDTTLNTVSPALPNASPATFDMRSYAPKYFLINGKAFATPFTGDIPVTAGNKVLLRYVNAGLQSHAMSTLGVSQSVIATDGFALVHPHSMVAETIATGQTLDTLVTIPAATANGTRFAIYDANLMLRNANASAMGGMLTFLMVGTATPPPPTGPVSSGETLTPNPTNGSVSVAVSASVSDVTTGGNTIDQAEFYVDSTAGSPTALSGAFGSSTVNVSGTISTGVLGILASGNHTIYVRGHDSVGWGPFTSAVLNLDKAGPTTSAVVVSPTTSNGTASVSLSASTSDVATGNSNITAGEYNIDSGTAIAMSVNITAPTAALSATLSAATVTALADGNHTINVRSQDAFGNWGAFASTTLKVDKTGPATSSLVANPNPNNGTKPFNTSTPAVRVTASFSDPVVGGANSNVVAAEGFLDTIGTTGTGFVFIATDGSFNSPAEPGYSDIPLAVVGALTSGNHTIYVHARDAAGNWGAMSTMILVIDKTPPTVLSINRAGANPINTASVQFTVTFSEAVTGVTTSNFTVVSSGLTGSRTITSITGSGATRTVTVSTGSGNGTIGLNLTSPTGIADLATNAMTSAGLPLVGQTYTIDRTRPTVSSINRVNASPTNAASVQFLVTFSESVTGGANSNFSLTTTGTSSGASVTSVSAGPGNTRTVTVNTGSTNGTIRLNMSNTTGVTDLAGNTVSNTPFTTGQTYTVDTIAPTVSSITRLDLNNTNAATVRFTVTFSESVTGGSAGNFTLVRTGTYAGGSITGITGTGTTRTVTVSTGTGTGTLRLDMTSSTGVADALGNAVSNIPFTTGLTYTIDKTAPTVTNITRLDPNNTAAATVRFTVTFSESVTGVTTSNFNLTTTGAVTGTSVVSVTGSGTTRIVTINTGTGAGTIRLNMISTTGITDSVGNPMSGSNLPFNGGANGTYTVT